MHIVIWIARTLFMIGLALAAGALGRVFIQPLSLHWYEILAKPPLSPPNWLFGVVWLALYILMGIAAGFVWNIPVYLSRVRQALLLFVIQLGMNVLWLVLFFGLRSIGWALIDIVILWMLVIIMTVLFYLQSKVAGLLLVPYLLWLTFAVYLNAGYWTLNH